MFSVSLIRGGRVREDACREYLERREDLRAPSSRGAARRGANYRGSVENTSAPFQITVLYFLRAHIKSFSTPRLRGSDIIAPPKIVILIDATPPARWARVIERLTKKNSIPILQIGAVLRRRNGCNAQRAFNGAYYKRRTNAKVVERGEKRKSPRGKKERAARRVPNARAA